MTSVNIANPIISAPSKGLSMSSPQISSLKETIRRSADRGHADHGWLNTYHTFSFSDYYNPDYANFHSLRVINEDRVAGGEGFGTHPHREYEIFSYVVQGALRHQDSMKNDEIVRRGDVQFTSAGTGISHSEYNASPKDLVHFIQIWVKPSQSKLKPGYQTKSFSDAEKLNKLRLIVSPAGEDGCITIHQDIKVYASILETGKSVSLPVLPLHDYHVHVIQDVKSYDEEYNEVGLNVNGSLLNGGDGIFLVSDKETKPTETINFQGASKGSKPVEFLVFEIAKSS